MLFKCLLTVSFMICICEVKAQKAKFSEKEMQGLYVLAGSWKMEKVGSTLYEEWKIEQKGRLTGKSYKVASGKTIPLESVRLYLTGGKIVYAPTAFGQNDEKEVKFLLERIEDSTYVFENKDHDFPRTISYKMIGRDSLSAYIEGIVNNKTKRINFNYTRSK